ncbi:nucleoside deaminase [Azohydromonas australica]|uniref:nucleoside deaminase n=1 Tax=Azohydromonas australica TaxID=364039 RepID=UPI0004249254|nr:nucleoside deaminase [Azohydromonas australica]
MSQADPNAEKYMVDALRLAMRNVRERKTWPFGAVLVRNGKVLANAVNEVDVLCDPSAHAEMQAVRMAAKAQGDTDLSGSVVYASGYPCSMCLTAMYLAGVKEVYYAYSNEDGEPYDLSAARGYVEIARPIEEREMPLRSLPVRDEGEDLYEAWERATR